MSQEYISSIVVVLVALLQIFKIKVLPEEITPIIVGFLGLWILIRRYQKGDITIYGQRIKK